MTSIIVKLVDSCRRQAWLSVFFFVALTSFNAWYVVTHFRMNTDVNTLLAEDIPWRQKEKELEKAFPGRNDLLVAVIDGKDSTSTENAAAALAAEMEKHKDLFNTVHRPDALPFFRKNGLLFLDQGKLTDVIDRLIQAQPMLGTLAADQSLRGFFRVFSLMLQGVQHGATDAAQLKPAFTKVTAIAREISAGRPAKLDWESLLNGEPDPHSLRRFILAQPKLDYKALSPGEKATRAVEAMRESLQQKYPVTIRLTGSVALNDQEFASVADGMEWATTASLILVCLLLFSALRSIKIVLPIFLTLASGLIASTAFGLAIIGSLNLISVAFAVMFIGIAVDFGIQFGTRFREQYFHHADPQQALHHTAKTIASPLLLAAISTAAGFLAFTPTDYAGVAELGLIAGAGMVIALLCNVTLLPALIALMPPPPEKDLVGFRWTSSLDNFLHRQRSLVMGAALLLALGSCAVMTKLRFDFDPLNLKDPRAESVATIFDLAKNLESTPYTAQALASSLQEADIAADKLRGIPEVARVMTLSSFIPENQEAKLQLLHDTQMILAATLTPTSFAPPAQDEDLIQSTKDLIAALDAQAKDIPEAKDLADSLRPIASNPERLSALQEALISGLTPQLVAIRGLLSPQPVTLESIPDALKEDWLTSDGRARIEIYPKINPRNPDALLRFNNAVQTIVPDATGTTIAIAESGNTIVGAFINAAIAALAIISCLLLINLRKIFDMMACLAPLILAALLTLACSVIFGIPINFANIIGLPLLLGLGVSFAIYFVAFWRDGGTHPLQSGMARAVLFSAATTLVAFASLALSSHPGTASMGKILTLALFFALTCSSLLLPALLRQDNRD